VNSIVGAAPRRLQVLWRTGGRLMWLVSIVGALGLMLWATWTSLSEINAQQLRLDGGMFICSLMVRSVALFLNIYLWSRILSTSGGTTSLSKNFVLYCYTNLVKRLPTPIWLMTGRAHLYEAAGTHVIITSMSTGVEAIVAMTSGLITILAFMPISLPDMPIEMKAISAIGAVVIWVVLSEPKLLRGVGVALGRVFKRPIQFERIHRRDLLYWNFIHTVSWVTGGIMMYFVIGILAPVNMAILPIVIWAWALSGLLGFLRFLMPFLFAAREISLAFLLSSLTPISLVSSVAASALSRLCLIIGDLLWAGIAVIIDKRP
jgi:hypothetical protein